MKSKLLTSHDLDRLIDTAHKTVPKISSGARFSRGIAHGNIIMLEAFKKYLAGDIKAIERAIAIPTEGNVP